MKKRTKRPKVQTRWFKASEPDFFSDKKKSAPLKVRITIYLDSDVIEYFRTKSRQSGEPYQTLINSELRIASKTSRKKITLDEIRKVIREELDKGLA